MSRQNQTADCNSNGPLMMGRRQDCCGSIGRDYLLAYSTAVVILCEIDRDRPINTDRVVCIRSSQDPVGRGRTEESLSEGEMRAVFRGVHGRQLLEHLECCRNPHSYPHQHADRHFSGEGRKEAVPQPKRGSATLDLTPPMWVKMYAAHIDGKLGVLRLFVNEGV